MSVGRLNYPQASPRQFGLSVLAGTAGLVRPIGALKSPIIAEGVLLFLSGSDNNRRAKYLELYEPFRARGARCNPIGV